MKKIVIYILLIFLNLNIANSNERSEKEIKLGVFLDDLNDIGSFEKIDFSPIGMFPETATGFHKKQTIANKKFIKIFISQKGLMEKYTDRVILGMAYFEYFYMQQLKENKKSLEVFEAKYPNVNAATKRNVKKLYGLNKAKKSMREALGLSLNDSPEVAIKRYYTLYKLLNQAEVKTIKISKEDKKSIKIHNKISKNISKLKSLIEDKKNLRLNKKKFNKEYNKTFKSLSKDLKKNKNNKDYELLTSFLIEIEKLRDNNLDALLSGYKISEFVLQNIKKDKIPKKFEQDLSNANFDDFQKEELEILGKITKSTKFNKNVKSNEIQLNILNLENSNIPVSRFLNVYKDELNVKLDTINLMVASSSEMKDWKLSDWANAWKNPIPKSIVDEAGIEITLSEDEIESIKAQLAMKNFKELLDLEEFNNLIKTNSDNFSQIANDLTLNTQSFEFSFTLDDFARSFGDAYGFDINNYSDLTDLANAQHGANWSVEEYSSVYQANVDVINSLAKGNFDYNFASQLGASLQDVADTIRVAASAGITVDLEATAQGLGYSSFADAVADYNAQHGTNYTVDEAKESLGQ
ncbi:hypothetical protein N9Y52_02015 [Candidatus Pelagibacter bacterium]|nr:hypothetical protein [Candidatus Pelagibacter bacterium]